MAALMRRPLAWLAWQLGVRAPAPIGTPAARIEVLTAHGKTVLTPSIKRAHDGDTPGRLDHQERTDDRHE
jgi:hypothetical protein